MTIRRVLIATDLSEPEDPAVREGTRYAHLHGAVLGFCHVIPKVRPENGAELAKFAELEWRAGQVVRAHVDRTADTELHEVKIFVDEGEPAPEILRRSEKWRADVLVVGTHPRVGLQRLLGSTAGHVIRHAHVPVVVARTPPGRASVLAATDLSEAADLAVIAGAEEAKARGLPLHVVHVLEVVATPYLPTSVAPYGMAPLPDAAGYIGSRDAANDALELILRRLDVEAIPEVLIGPAAETIALRAQEIEADLVVVSTHGRTGLARVLLGSVTEHVLRIAPCSVLAARTRTNQPSA